MKHDFLCVGFAKCGTTTLHEILRQHKDIYLPVIKEPRYYDIPEIYKKGFEWYKKRYYPKKINKKIVGEINPSITIYNNASKVFHDYGKDIKLIFIMRNPVERLFSHYKQYTKIEDIKSAREQYEKSYSNSQLFDHFIQKSFKRQQSGKIDVITSYYRKVIQRGNYADQINVYLKYYPIEKMKFIILEDFIKDPKKICKEIFDFLEIREDNKINYKIQANEGNRIARNPATLQIYRFFDDVIWNCYLLNIPFISENFTKFNYFLRNNIKKALTKPSNDKSKISVISKKLLEDYYREDKNKLEKIINRDLDIIWFK